MDSNSPQSFTSSTPDPVLNSPKRFTKPYNKLKHGNRLKLTDKVSIAAMKESGMSAMEIANATNSHVSTIYRVWEDPELSDLAPSSVRSIKTGLGGLFYKRALQSTLSISSEKLSQSSALQLATVAGIMTEKGRLMEGLSTDNVSFRGISQSIDEDRAKLMAKLNDLVDDKT